MEDVFEAFMGALSLETTFENCRLFLTNLIDERIDFAELINIKTNYKDMLSKYMQHTLQDMPRFFEISVDIKHNKKVFDI